MIDPKEAIQFFRTQLSRCKINLKGARDRKDEKAINNIQHKMEIYQYVLSILKGGTQE